VRSSSLVYIAGSMEARARGYRDMAAI
jgi:hypothetical protein